MTGFPFFFPDNTVLINMAVLGRVDLLERFTSGRGRWCASIEYEWRRSQRILRLERADQQVRSLCGQPIHPDEADYVDIKALRDRMLGPDDGPTSHFGEAETIVIIRRRPELYGSIFLTDDQSARSHADAEDAVDRCLGTAELLAYFEAAGWLTRSQAHGCLDTLRDSGRYVRPSDAGGYDRLVESLLRRVRGRGRLG